MGDLRANYTFKKRGIFYFERRVPADLRKYYFKNKIVTSLRTKRPQIAMKLSNQLAGKLDLYWSSLRTEIFGELFCGKDLKKVKVSIHGETVTIMDALHLYLELKGIDKGERFKRYAYRSINFLIKVSGNKFLHQFSRQDANMFRDTLVKRGLVLGSVKRNFQTVSAIFNLALREKGMEILNPFSNMIFGKVKEGSKRLPIPIAEIRLIQNECYKKDDDIRWLIALLSDTGMRLAEACGLLIEDLIVDADIPHLVIRPHLWRLLKTEASQRKIPLVGASLWAAKRLIENKTNDLAFPRYCSSSHCKADYASSALNKWLRPMVSKGCVIHSFRHSFRDRLRNVDCPSEMVDQLGGWSSVGVGYKYGKGYDLRLKKKYMINI